MKKKYIQSFIFLILLILAVLSQCNISFSVVPGWHSVVYPPNYIIQLSLIILSLIIGISGYAFLSYKKRALNSRIFALHLLLTLPLIIALIYPFNNFDMTSLSEDEFERILLQRKWFEYTLFAVFALGQLIFLICFIKQVRLRNNVETMTTAKKL